MTIEIKAKLVQQLREKTGAGMMNCKKALTENNGDFEKAVESLKLKGMAIADKKSSRSTNEGMIYAYVHTGNKIGILVEINCETDFVAKRPEFSELAKNIAMQIASNSNIEVVSSTDVAKSIKDETWRFESQKEDLENKSEDIKFRPFTF